MITRQRMYGWLDMATAVLIAYVSGLVVRYLRIRRQYRQLFAMLDAQLGNVHHITIPGDDRTALERKPIDRKETRQ